MYNWLRRGTENSVWSTSGWLGQEVAVKGGGDYTFTVWAKNSGASQTNLAELYIDWMDSFGSEEPDSDAIAVSDIEIPVATDSWTQLDFGAIHPKVPTVDQIVPKS